jgi:hypothetical protein
MSAENKFADAKAQTACCAPGWCAVSQSYSTRPGSTAVVPKVWARKKRMLGRVVSASYRARFQTGKRSAPCRPGMPRVLPGGAPRWRLSAPREKPVGVMSVSVRKRSGRSVAARATNSEDSDSPTTSTGRGPHSASIASSTSWIASTYRRTS